MSAYIILTTAWFLVFIFVRIALAKTYAPMFNWYAVHHFDAGFVLSIYGYVLTLVGGTVIGPIFIIAGVFTMLDDMIGHARASRGHRQQWVLQPLLKPLLPVYHGCMEIGYSPPLPRKTGASSATDYVSKIEDTGASSGSGKVISFYGPFPTKQGREGSH